MTAIQKLAGHASIKMTLRYAHLSPRYLADEVKTLDKYHGNDKPADATGTNAEGTPAEVAPQTPANCPMWNGMDLQDHYAKRGLRRSKPTKRIHRCMK